MYNQLVLKSVTVGTGYNDLGILTTSNLEEVPVEDMILPKEKDKEYNGRQPWVDSGRDSVTGVGAQLYLVKGEYIKAEEEEKQYDLEDLPVKPMYHNEREVRHLKARSIDKGVVAGIREIEESIYKLMLNAQEGQKQIRFEATEDTSYINIVKMAKKGLVHIQEDGKRDWGNSGDIKMHDMKITVDKEKMKEELAKVRVRLAKKREESLFRKVEDKNEEGR